MDWQQIIVLVLVLAAVVWLVKKLVFKPKTSCGCDDSCSSSPPNRPKT